MIEMHNQGSTLSNICPDTDKEASLWTLWEPNLFTGSVSVVIYPLSLFSFHYLFCRHETKCSYVHNRMEVPLMC